ncbi:MAG: glycosyltransferase family 39 protein [Candidatus Methanoperedens sp.]|nr:glycosyltransferase family 39 protein [Candidatus Methanoperedens sp.]
MKDGMLDLSGKRAVLAIYIGIVLLKVLLSFQIPSPFISSDEVSYSKMAQSFYEEHKFLIDVDLPSQSYPPLYSFVISSAYFLGDINIAYPAMKIINILISSLIVIPVWLIAKEFLDSEKSLFIVILTVLLPSAFSYPFIVISESLLYPLFMLSIYLIIKSIRGDKAMGIWCGIVMFLTVLTKSTGYVLPIAIFIIFIIENWKDIFSFWNKRNTKNIISAAWNLRWILISFISLLIIWKYIQNLWGLGGGTGGTDYNPYESISTINDLISVTSWSIMHMGYFVFATMIIFFIFALVLTQKYIGKKIPSENLAVLIIVSWTTLVLLIIVSAQSRVAWGAGASFAVMGRYIDPILPAFLIMGAIGFEYKRDKSFWLATAISIIALWFIPLDSRLRSINAPDTYLLVAPSYLHETGIIPFEVNVLEIKLILASIVLIISILLWKNIFTWKTLKYASILFFIASSVLAFGVAYTASHDVQDHMIIGHWLRENTPPHKVVLFDERDFNGTSWPWFAVTFWTDDRYVFGNVTNESVKIETANGSVNKKVDYIVSIHKLDNPLLLEVHARTQIRSHSDNVYYLYSANQSR